MDDKQNASTEQAPDTSNEQAPSGRPELMPRTRINGLTGKPMPIDDNGRFISLNPEARPRKAKKKTRSKTKRTPKRKRTDTEKAYDRVRKRQQRAREQHRKDLVAMVFDKPDTEMDQGQHKSRLQLQNEARLELREEVLLLASKGKATNDIAIEMNMRVDTVQRMLAESLEQMARYFSQASPRENFCRYAAFNLALVKRLDRLVDSFSDDKENRQYTAATSAIRTMSELYDRIVDRGAKLGIIQERKASKEATMRREDLLEALRTERTQMDALIAELEVTVIERTTKVVRRDGVTVDRATHGGASRALRSKKERSELGGHGSNGGQKVLPEPVADVLAAEIVAERTKDRGSNEGRVRFDELIARDQRDPDA